MLLFSSGEKVSFVVHVGQMPSSFVKERALNISPRGKTGQPAAQALPSGSGSAELLFPRKLFRTVAVH